jgi:hypothetical protein
LEKHTLARAQRRVCVQAVPSSNSCANRAGPTSGRDVGASGNLDNSRSRNCYIVPQHSIHRSAETVVPVPLGSVQVGRVESAYDKVTIFDIVDGASSFDNLAAGVGARDDHVLDGEGVCAIADSNIAIVQRDTLDFDENFMLVWRWDLLLMELYILKGSA